MKPKLRWLLLLIPLALFAWAYGAASWRPKMVGVQPNVSSGSSSWYPLLIVSPDGERMASYTLANGRSLALWDVASRKMLWQHSNPMTGWLKPLAFSPDSRVLAVVSETGTFGGEPSGIDLLDADSGQRRRRMVATGNLDLQSVGFLSPRELVIASHRGASVVETQTGKTVRQWSFDVPVPTRKQYPTLPQSHVSADGKTVVVLAKGKGDSSLTLYDARSGAKRRAWKIRSVYRRPRLSPDGSLCVLQRQNRDTAEVYDCANGQQLWGPFASDSIDLSWSWSADGRQITSFADPSLMAFDARTGRKVANRSIAGSLQTYAADPRGNYFCILDDQGIIWRWRLR